MMTACTTTLGLVPLALGAGETGKEMLHPLAITIIGGLISGTILVQLVFPSLVKRFGKRAFEMYEATAEHEDEFVDEHAVPADLMALARRVERRGGLKEKKKK